MGGCMEPFSTYRSKIPCTPAIALLLFPSLSILKLSRKPHLLCFALLCSALHAAQSPQRDFHLFEITKYLPPPLSC